MPPFPVHIDPRDATPIYAQLDRGIRVAIAHRRLKPGDQLPTVRQLAVELRINANTVAKVYLALEREGVVTTKRGVGTFVAEGNHPEAQGKHRERQLGAIIDRFLTDATSSGFTPREVLRFLAQKVKEGDQS